jgi:Xaa-Pro aminopeptidase
MSVAQVDGRIHRAQARMVELGVGALLLGPSADLAYLTGYHAPPLERLTLLILPSVGEPTLVVPALEAPRADVSGAGEHARIRSWRETDDPFDVVAASIGEVSGGPFAVQDRLWATFLLGLQQRLPGREWLLGSQVMRDLRSVKHPDEIAALARAGAAIDAVHAEVPRLLRVGATEAEVGHAIADVIRTSHDDVNFVIVGSGPNGASPHHKVGSRRLDVGDAVVVDIGGTLDGYCSDATRNYVLGSLPDGYRELHDVLRHAQQAAVDAVRPGVAAEEVDAVARRLIDDAGHGEHFVHRTGHGIGLEEHEDPYIVAGNHELLLAGMAFSVEPGIYVPDRYGARIEDIVTVTDDGVRPLNTRPHDVVVV